jgi:hypothetical protein
MMLPHQNVELSISSSAVTHFHRFMTIENSSCSWIGHYIRKLHAEVPALSCYLESLGGRVGVLTTEWLVVLSVHESLAHINMDPVMAACVRFLTVLSHLCNVKDCESRPSKKRLPVVPLAFSILFRAPVPSDLSLNYSAFFLFGAGFGKGLQ